MLLLLCGTQADTPDYPKGCYVADGSAAVVYFNFDAHGSANRRASLICRDLRNSSPNISPSSAVMADTVCSGWTPTEGKYQGQGGTCATWGWTMPWCYVRADYSGPGHEFMKPSLEYDDTMFVPCSVGTNTKWGQDHKPSSKYVLVGNGVCISNKMSLCRRAGKRCDVTARVRCSKTHFFCWNWSSFKKGEACVR